MVVITRIPVRYNNRKPIPKKLLKSTFAEVYDQFEGYSLEGPGRGMWSDANGRAYSEESYRLEIATERNRYSEARETVIAIGHKLKQKAMYFEVRYFDGIEIINIA